jgi:hypothetical protein
LRPPVFKLSEGSIPLPDLHVQRQIPMVTDYVT